jgi:hypothetical protein
MMIDVNRADRTRGAICEVHVRIRCSGFGSWNPKPLPRNVVLSLKLAAMARAAASESGIRAFGRCKRFLPLVQ